MLAGKDDEVGRVHVGDDGRGAARGLTLHIMEQLLDLYLTAPERVGRLVGVRGLW